MKLKKLIAVMLTALLLFTVCASGAFAAEYRVEVQGASNPRVTDTVKSYLDGFGCTGLNGTLTVKIVQLLENSGETPTSAGDSAINHDADDPKIDYYAEFSAHYDNGVRDDATITYEEAVKEDGAWKTVSESTFTMDRQYIVACYVETDDLVDAEQIFANFGNGATFLRVTSSCAPGSAYLVPTKLVTPTGSISGNVFERFIKAIKALFAEIKAFFSMFFGR